MATKTTLKKEALYQTIQLFLNTEPDVPSIYQVPQQMEVQLIGSKAFIPCPSRRIMNQNHGSPVHAIQTKTDPVNKKVYFYPAPDPTDQSARVLTCTSDKSGGYFSLGVPLRILNLTPTNSRQFTLPINTLEIPGQGTVYWISFTDYEKESRPVTKKAAASRQAAAASSTPD